MNSLGEVIAQVHRLAPLIHCLTAAVSMNFVADALPAIPDGPQ